MQKMSEKIRNSGRTFCEFLNAEGLHGFGWGYWQYDKEFTGFLTKGTYYAVITTKKENYRQDFDGNVNVIEAAIPVPDIFGFHVKTASNQKTATVSIADALGPYAKSVQYRKGNVSPAHVNDSAFWKKRTTGGPDDAIILSAGNGRYSFKTSENGIYTVMVEDTGGKRYSSTVKVSGIDDKKPAACGNMAYLSCACVRCGWDAAYRHKVFG